MGRANVRIGERGGPGLPPLSSCDQGGTSVLREWFSGAVYIHRRNSLSRPALQVRAAWCSYLRDGDFGPFRVFASWSQAHTQTGLSLDPGIEWARSTPVTWNGTLIYFDADSIGHTAGETQFAVRTTIVSRAADSSWSTRATHVIHARTQNDSVWFESELIRRAAGGERFRAGRIVYYRLDGGAVNAPQARAAVDWLGTTDARLKLSPTTTDTIRYFYGASEPGHRALGFREFPEPIDGFAGRSADIFVFANVSAAGERHTHELVHAAIKSRRPPAGRFAEEAIARVVGGTRSRRWADFVCDDSQFLLERESVADLAGLLRKPDAQVRETSQEWEFALLLDRARQRVGDSVLVLALGGRFDGLSRQQRMTSFAQLLGLSESTFRRDVEQYYSGAEVRARCRARRVRR